APDRGISPWGVAVAVTRLPVPIRQRKEGRLEALPVIVTSSRDRAVLRGYAGAMKRTWSLAVAAVLVASASGGCRREELASTAITAEIERHIAVPLREMLPDVRVGAVACPGQLAADGTLRCTIDIGGRPFTVTVTHDRGSREGQMTLDG